MEQLQDLGLSPMSAFGATLLRFVLAGFWIIHWWFKVGYRGMAATEAFFLQHGLPTWLAWFVVSFEVVVAVCLALGIYVPLLCLVSLPILFVSMWIYRGNGFYFRVEELNFPFSGLVRKSLRYSSALAPFGSHIQRGCHSFQPCLVSGFDERAHYRVFAACPAVRSPHRPLKSFQVYSENGPPREGPDVPAVKRSLACSEQWSIRQSLRETLSDSTTPAVGWLCMNR